MSFFHDYLRRHEQEILTGFDEQDESWFVFSLLMMRLGLGPALKATMSRMAPGRAIGQLFPFASLNDPLSSCHFGPESGASLHFVAAFLCYFVVKPPRYREEIHAFKRLFIPGFFGDPKRQSQLLDCVKPAFSQVQLRDAKWETVRDYFDVNFLTTPSTPSTPSSFIPPTEQNPPTAGIPY